MTGDDSFFESSDFKDCLRKYEEAHEQGLPIYLDPDNFADIAEYYYGKGCGQKALAVIDEALAMFPGATALWVFKARMALLSGGNAEEAYRLLSLAEDKENPEYTYMLAEIMLFEDKAQQADLVFQNRLEKLEEDEREYLCMDAANLFADYEQFEQARKWFELLEPSEDSQYKELQGRIALGIGHYDDSESIFRELLEEDPFSSHYWNNLASLQFLRNKFNDSITSSEFSIAINPDDSEAILNKGNGLFSIGNYEEALVYYDRYSRLEPDDATGEMLKGVTLIRLNKVEEALSHFTKAEEMTSLSSPDLSEIYQEIAFTLSRLGRVEEALEYVDKKQKLTKDNLCDTMLLKGHILLEHDSMERAQEAFQEAVRLSDDSPRTFLQIAISVYDCGYIHLAYSLLLAYFDGADDTCQDGYSYLALCAKELGKESEFLKAVKMACETNPTEARMVLSELFPEGMDVEDFYPYLISCNKGES